MGRKRFDTRSDKRTRTRVFAVRWINISLYSMFVSSRSFWIASVVTLAASFAVSYRTVICQAQAYAILAASATCALLWFAEAHNSKAHRVGALSDFFCTQCGSISEVALAIGVRSHRVATHYEMLYGQPVRGAVTLAVWLVWIAYGALFHSAGEHTEHEFDLLHNTIALGDGIPEMLVRTREVALVVQSLVFTWATSRSGANVTANGGLRGGKWIPHLSMAFFGLLFAPTSHSTAQGLLPGELLRRTSLYLTLFLLCETLDRLRAYSKWMASANADVTLLENVEMALSRARPLPTIDQQRRRTRSRLDACPEPLIGSQLDAHALMARLSVVPRAAWVLVAGELYVNELGIAYALLLLALIARQRWTVSRSVEHTRTSLPVKLANRGDIRHQLPATGAREEQRLINSGGDGNLSASDDASGSESSEPPKPPPPPSRSIPQEQPLINTREQTSCRPAGRPASQAAPRRPTKVANPSTAVGAPISLSLLHQNTITMESVLRQTAEYNSLPLQDAALPRVCEISNSDLQTSSCSKPIQAPVLAKHQTRDSLVMEAFGTL